jgi:hypothetical protein
MSAYPPIVDMKADIADGSEVPEGDINLARLRRRRLNCARQAAVRPDVTG